MYKAIDIAKWFVEKAEEEGKLITKMKMIKLCFIAQGIHLSVYREALFSDSVQAWKYGPVINTLYERFKNYKFDQIKLISSAFNGSEGIINSDKETLKILNLSWDKFGNYNAIDLSNWTHREGSAWDIAFNYEDGKNILAHEISHKLIIEEFDKITINNNQTRKYRPGDCGND